MQTTDPQIPCFAPSFWNDNGIESHMHILIINKLSDLFIYFFSKSLEKCNPSFCVSFKILCSKNLKVVLYVYRLIQYLYHI